MGRALDNEGEERKGISERGNVRSKNSEMESSRHIGTIDRPAEERVGVHVTEFGKLVQVSKRRVMWIELSLRKLNLMVH